MAKYFDAFLYLANWGTRTFKLRLPSGFLSAEAKQPYLDGESFTARRAGGHVVLTFNLEQEPGSDAEEGGGQLAALIRSRAENRSSGAESTISWRPGCQRSTTRQ